MNQVANRFANQPNDWERMHCFLATFHQKEYCFECQWWMMRSNHARLIQNILNHIKWRFQFPSFLFVLRISDWLILLGSFSLEDNCQLVQRTAFYPVCLHQKKFHICPCSQLYIQRFDFKFQNGMLGSHSYGKSPVTSSNKSCSAFQMVVQATKLCSLCFMLGSPSISKSSIESHRGDASVSWLKQNAIHLSVDCWIKTNISKETTARFGRLLIVKSHYLWNKQCIQPMADCYFH